MLYLSKIERSTIQSATGVKRIPGNGLRISVTHGELLEISQTSGVQPESISIQMPNIQRLLVQADGMILICLRLETADLTSLRREVISLSGAL